MSDSKINHTGRAIDEVVILRRIGRGLNPANTRKGTKTYSDEMVSVKRANAQSSL